mmetsp:Transcript_9783/g.14592  ORF Transcript_9783/g.14592 Transcript_9783/m.14592 type:complete len:86 (-) Transcript_9783:148-405(-)
MIWADKDGKLGANKCTLLKRITIKMHGLSSNNFQRMACYEPFHSKWSAIISTQGLDLKSSSDFFVSIHMYIITFNVLPLKTKNIT